MDLENPIDEASITGSLSVSSDMVVLALALAQELLSHERPIRTSNIEQGIFVLCEYGIHEEAGADTLYLARKGKTGPERLVRIPSLRFDRHLPDKVFVVDDRIVILVSSGAGRYQHCFVRKRGSEYCIERWPEGAADDYIGSHSVVKIGENLLGCVGISPDFSATIAGNYLYAYSPSQLKFGRLPGKDGGYEIIAGRGAEEFHLVRWQPNISKMERTTHRLPFAMKDGVWKLHFPR